MFNLLLTDPVHHFSGGRFPREEVPVASYRKYRSTGALVPVAPSSPHAAELRARAARYRKLADTLCDPHVIAEVQACARELDTEAAWIAKQASFGARTVNQRYRSGEGEVAS